MTTPSPQTSRRLPPWKQPLRLLWFGLALCAACTLIVYMPGKLSPEAKLLAKGRTFARLFVMVGVAAFFAGLLEARRWHMVLARWMGGLVRMARLPEVVGLAMPAALFSNAAANSILVASHEEGRIPNTALIAGGMTNSYLTYVSHSLRVMIPVVGAIGLPAMCYFGIQFTGGLCVIVGVMLWNRLKHLEQPADYAAHRAAPEGTSEEQDSHSAPAERFSQGGVAASTTSETDKTSRNAPLPWPAALRLAAVRSASLLFRMVCITIPLMLGMEWLIKLGVFQFWERYVPDYVNHIFPSELMFIVAAQMGGLIQSASVAANLRSEGIIDDTQILLAMLVASAIGNPFRLLRRNLPSALGIFAVRDALIIVLGMQLSRLITTVGAIVFVILFMHTELY